MSNLGSNIKCDMCEKIRYVKGEDFHTISDNISIHHLCDKCYLGVLYFGDMVSTHYKQRIRSRL